MIKPFAESPLTEGQRKYRDFLASAEWQETRALIIDMDGGRCRICGSTEDLAVHHFSYNEDWLKCTNLITVCRRCHEILTRAVEEARGLRYSLVDFKNTSTVDAAAQRLLMAIRAKNGEFMAKTLFELYKGSLKQGGTPINILDLQTTRQIAEIVASTLNGQVYHCISFLDCNYVMRLHKLVNEYRAQACRHYLEEGFSPAEIQRFLGLNDAQMAKVMRNARKEEVTAGG